MNMKFIYLPLLSLALTAFCSCKKNDAAEETAAAQTTGAQNAVSPEEMEKAKKSDEDDKLVMEFYYRANHAAEIVRIITPENLTVQKEELQKECDALQGIHDKFYQSFKVLVVSSGEAQEKIGRLGDTAYAGLDAALVEFNKKAKDNPGAYQEIQPLVQRLTDIVNNFVK